MGKSSVKIVAAAIFIAVILPARSYSQPRRYQIDDNGLSMEFSDEWKQSDQDQLTFIMDSDDAMRGKVRAGFSIFRKAVSQEASADTYIKQQIDIIKKSSPQGVEQMGSLNVNGLAINWVLYHHQDTRQIRYMLVKNDCLYLFTFAINSGLFANYKDKFDKLIHSIRFDEGN